MRLVSTQYSLPLKAFELYLAGCREHPCKNCFSPELWSEDVGTQVNDEVYYELKNNIDNKLTMIDNIMIFGGEPLEKPKEEIIKLLLFLKQFNKPIWLFTRFKYEQVDKDILSLLDYIKCGMYLELLKSPGNTQYGITLATSNQQIYKLSEEQRQ